MRDRAKGRRGKRNPRRSRPPIPTPPEKKPLLDDQVRRQQPAYISGAEFEGVKDGLAALRPEFEKEGMRFKRGPKYAPVAVALIRALCLGRIPVSALRGLEGEDDVLGKYGKGAAT